VDAVAGKAKGMLRSTGKTVEDRARKVRDTLRFGKKPPKESSEGD
jgi:hypothetical protein